MASGWKLISITIFVSCAPLLSLAAPLHRVRDTRTYIVKLRSGIALNAHLSGSDFARYHDRVYDPRVLNGYTIDLTPSAMDALKTKFAGQVEYVEEDRVVQIASEVVQTEATWGLQIITQEGTLPAGSNATALNYTYRYDSSGGEGVDIYVFDTGVYIEHEEFEGRATRAPVFARGSRAGDIVGHAAGAHYGVVKKANIIDVKVLPDDQPGSVADIVAGLSWAVGNAQNTNRTGVINMSLGGGSSTAFSDAVRQTVASGLTVVVAAGNAATSATTWSPANVDEAIVVGNLDITGGMYWTSNYGPTLDVFAPGTNVVSAGVSSPNAVKIDTGTSMAAPHVAGLAAYLLALEGPRAPAELGTRIIELSVPGVFSGLAPNTTNLVVQSVA